MTALDVTFRIVRPQTPESVEVVASLVDIVRRAVCWYPEMAELPVWTVAAAKLRAGEAVRFHLCATEFCRFFLLRRAAGVNAVRRIKWIDAVEVEDPDE